MSDAPDASCTRGTERVGCYRWMREGCEDTFWSEYPAATERFEKSEATILFWDVVTGDSR